MSRDDLWEQFLIEGKRPITPGDHEIDRRQLILSRMDYERLYAAAIISERDRCITICNAAIKSPYVSPDGWNTAISIRDKIEDPEC